MLKLTPKELQIFDEILSQIIPRCKIVLANSESKVVRAYIEEVIGSALELRDFLDSPVAAVVFNTKAARGEKETG